MTQSAISINEEKKRAYQAAVDHLADIMPLCRYGDTEKSLNVEDVATAARRYMVSLYDRSDLRGNLDALRAHLFGNIKGDIRFFTKVSPEASQQAKNWQGVTQMGSKSKNRAGHTTTQSRHGTLDALRTV